MDETRLRVRYAKKASLRYLSHLEVARALERACRRADLPVALSEGFNPHYKLVFATNLPVGVSGCSEFLDLLLTRAVPPVEVIEELNAYLPLGLRALQAGEVPARGPALQSLDQLHTLLICGGPADRMRDALAALGALSALEVTRKKGARVLDAPGRFIQATGILPPAQTAPGCACDEHAPERVGLWVNLFAPASGGGLKVNDLLHFICDYLVLEALPAAARTDLKVSVDGAESDPLVMHRVLPG